MIKLLLVAGLVLLFAVPAPAREESLLARVTVYWRTGIPKCDLAHATGARLRVGPCAVDPKKIPYGSKVFLPTDRVWQSIPDQPWSIGKPRD